MSNVDAIVGLASDAVGRAPHPDDAADIAIDTAALLAVEFGVDIEELADRLKESFETFRSARQSISTHGIGASAKTQ